MGEGTKRPQVGGGKRGSISAFTGASRRRFLWKLAGLRNGAFHGSLFITLTYPVGEFSPRQQKRHLDLFLRRLRYMFPDSAGVWKLEYTERDEAHFHILLLGVGYFEKGALSTVWASIVRSQHPAHKVVGTQIAKCKSPRHASRYLGKYIGKRGHLPADHFGRVWGTFGQLERFQAEKVCVAVDRSELVKLRRVMDLVRRSLSGSRRRFRRRSDLHSCQRWFMEGSSAMVLAGRLLDLPELLDLGPPPPHQAFLN